MKFDMKKMFHDRKFRYGGYSTLITAVVLAILLVVNLVAGKLNVNVDLTKNKLYSLSDQSYKVLEGLKQNVTIYGFYQSGTEDPIVKEILSKYQKGSDKINIVYKDPIKYPQFAAQFDTDGVQVGEGSIVVQSGKKTKVISYTDLMDQSYDQTTGQPTSSSLLAEQKVTGAIMNVTSENNPVVYVLQGHDEAALATQVSQKLTDYNYTVKDLNLLNEASKLEDGSTLLVVSPQIDLSKDETATLKDFLAKGGKAVFLMDVTKEDLPNFNSLLNSYGMSIKRTVAVEGDSNYYYQQPIYLVPNIESQDITLPLITKKLVVVTPVCQAIDILEAKKASLKVEPLLTTSDNSWGKKNLESAVADKEPGDYPGPLNIAVAATDTSGSTQSRIVAVGNAHFASSDFIGASGNMDFLMNSLNWVQNRQEAISVGPKSLDAQAITMNMTQQLVYSGIAVILIPLAFIAAGIVVWLRRRNQ